MPRLKRSVGAAALALACGVHAGNLFVPVDAAGGAAALRSIEMAPDARKQQVQIARQELRAARDDVENTGAGRLLLNVAGGAHLDVVVERTTQTKWGYSLSGRVAGGAGGVVTLVVHEEAVAGSIWTPNAEYELSHVGGGIHALRDVTNAPPFECGGALQSEMATADATAQGRTDDGSVVDILVVWTPEAEDEYGGSRPQILSRIDLMIAYANDAFERSGAFMSLNLAGAEKVDYVETESISEDFRRLYVPDDGYMDGVHARRDALGADLVYMMTSRTVGRALQLGAFSAGSDNGYLFAHEVGHNMGLGHDRAEWLDQGAIYSYGFTTEHCFGTIMSSISSCNRLNGGRLPFFASPWRYDPSLGVPLGVTRFAKEQGAYGPADAILTLNRNRHRVASYRPSRGGE